MHLPIALSDIAETLDFEQQSQVKKLKKLSTVWSRQRKKSETLLLITFRDEI